MKALNVERLTTRPDPSSKSQLVETLNVAMLDLKFKPGKTTRKMRKHIIQAIVRSVKGYTPKENGKREEDSIGFTFDRSISPDALIAQIVDSYKYLPGAVHLQLDASIGDGELYLMGPEA